MNTAASAVEHALRNRKLCGRYHLVRLISKTENTQIWAVRDDDGRIYDAKLTTLDLSGNTRSSHKAELDVFLTLTDGRMRPNRRLNIRTPDRFPDIFFFGRHRNMYDVIVREGIVSDVYSLMNNTIWRSLATTAEYMMFADGMILALRSLHFHGIVHRNVNLYNFGTSNTDFLYVTNFSKARPYIDPVTRQHLALGSEQTFIGSLKYASVNAHQFLTLSRKDDLISLGYSIIDVMKRGLPWDRVLGNHTFAELVDIVKQVKQRTSLENLCQGLPNGIFLYMEAVYSMNYYETPNYNALRSMMGQLVITHQR